MMMRAIDAGGIPALFSPCRDRALVRNSTMLPDYHPNPHGFFEIADLRKLKWSKAGGRCVKVIRDNLPDLVPPGNYRAVYVTRNPDEIRRSYVGTMSGPPSAHEFKFLDDYAAKVTADVERLEQLGAEVCVLRYREIVANPSQELSRIGWPIDVRRAAATVDHRLYRHREAAWQ